MREGWHSKTLGELGTLTSSKRIFKSEYVTGGIPFYRSKEIKELGNGSDISLELYITNERYNEIKNKFGVPKKGDILLTAVGTIGEMYVVDESHPFYFKDGNIMWLKNFNSLDSYFLKYALTLFVEQLKAMSQGSAYSALTIEKLKKYSIPAPSLTEQRQIVAILDQAFEAIDQAKTNIEKNIQNAKELFQSKLNEIFSQKGDGSALSADKWEEKRLQDISLEFGRGKSKHRPRNDEKLYNGDYPFVQTGNIRNADKILTTYTQSYNEVGLAQSKLWPKGTICITIAANIAETAIIDFDACFPDSIIGVVVDPSKANLDYTYYALQYLKSELQAKGKGSAQDNINMGTFQSQFFPYPDLKTQEWIVKELDSLKTYTNSLVEGSGQKLKSIDELKKSILQKAFAGELSGNKAKAYGVVSEALAMAAEGNEEYKNH
jgi:type I restriction enzyme S subunit